MSRGNYYAETLAGARLRRCYDVAPPRVRQALGAEIEFAGALVRAGSIILELGCGYGRVLRPLAERARRAIGIDTSPTSLRMAREFLHGRANCHVAAMNAASLAFPDRRFDAVVCVQNGLSAFHLDPQSVMREACRVVRPGGTAVFSSYSERFWPQRLEWFRIQSEEGLIGQLDEDATGDGVIVCRDGFRATTLRIADFQALTDDLGVPSEIVEVDESTVFCVIHVSGDEDRRGRTEMPDTRARTDRRAIRRLYKSWFEAMQSGDVATLMALVTPDVIVEMPGSPPRIGSGAFEAALRAFHESYTETVEHEVLEVDVQGGRAVVQVAERATLRSRADASVATARGLHRAILIRQPDGTWLVSRDTATLDLG